MSLDKFLDQVDDGVDPRVQVELERLNTATDEINKLEVDLDEARNQFRQLLQESTSRIDSCAKKLGSCIIKVRPYYDARLKAREALLETQKAAVNFERANSAHAAAKEMVYLAEEGLKAEGRTFDHAWQEMLNHATMRVNESESERTKAEAEHKRTSQKYQLSEIRVHTLQKELKRAITKSRPYFELKIHYNQLLEKQKIKVKNLEKQVTEVKLTYAHTLKNLEQISDEIHKTRQRNKHHGDLGKRSEGVGAESDAPPAFTRFYGVARSKSSCGEAERSLREPETAHSLPLSDTALPSQAETEVRSGGSGAGNFNGSPNSENESSLTGPPDTESEDEVFRFPEKSNSVESPLHSIKESGPIPSLKGAGDYNSNDVTENIGPSSVLEKHVSASLNSANARNSYFEGVGICSFPVETDLNLKFNGGDNKREDGAEAGANSGSGWTEIKLRSPEEETFSTVKVVTSGGKHRSELEEDLDIPYAPLSGAEGDLLDCSPDERRAGSAVEEFAEPNGMLCGLGGRSARREAEGEEPSARSLKGTPKKLNLRRQSLDVLWNNTAGEKMKEILSQSIMKLNIGSLTERKSSMESKGGEGSEYCEEENSVNNGKGNDGTYESNLTSQFGINFFNRKNSKTDEDFIRAVAGDDKKLNSQDSISTQIGGFISRKDKFFAKKVPSPLEKTLNYLNADDESNSDSESLASSDMLTDEQLSSLILDRDLAEIYQDII